MKQLLVVCVVLFSLCAIAHAEILVAPSLEWLADHCIESGVYVVTDVKEKEGTNGVELTLSLKRTFRGEPATEIRQGYYKVRLSDLQRAFVKKGDSFLVCFQHYSTGEKRAVQTINLDNPQTAGFSMIAASCELKLLKTKEGILKAFEDRLKSHQKGDPVEISDYSKDNRFELEGHTELFSAVWGGSSCYLRVPKDLVENVRVESQRQEQEANKALHGDAVNRARER